MALNETKNWVERLSPLSRKRHDQNVLLHKNYMNATAELAVLPPKSPAYKKMYRLQQESGYALVTANMGFVVDRVKPWTLLKSSADPSYLEEELIAAGRAALWEGIPTWDPTQATLVSYLDFKIKNAIKATVRLYCTRLSEYDFQAAYTITQYIKSVEKQGRSKRSITIKEIVEAMELPKEQVLRVVKEITHRTPWTLDHLETRQAERAKQRSATKHPLDYYMIFEQPESTVSASDSTSERKRALADKSAYEIFLLTRYTGLDGAPGETNTHLARYSAVSKEAVRRLVNKDK